MKHRVQSVVAALSLDAILGVTGAAFSPILPPSYPLAVRNPYLSVWLPGNETSAFANASPQFWFGNDLTWSVMARVDGQAYNLFGVTAPPAHTSSATLLNASYTSTHSVFAVSAGSVVFELDFFSPVSFGDYVRQSLPFSYLSVTATPSAGKAHTVEVYSDIGEDWTGQSSGASCSFATSSNTSIFEVSANGATYSQSSNEQALWGTVVHAAQGTNVHSGSGVAATLRSTFQSTGSLSGNACQQGGAYAFAYKLGSIGSATTVRFAVGVVRTAAINYLGAPRTHYYRSQYPDIVSAVTHFFSDYSAAASEAATLDSTISSTATSLAGSNYSDILALSTRQVFGAIDITIPNATLDTSSPFAFIKEISSDGNVNTIDIIFPLFPFFYVFAPTYFKLLLNPVLEYLASGRYPNPWAIHDIGANYPNATGHDDGGDEAMPVEETGNLLILFSAYETATGDKSWSQQYSALLAHYALWLSQNGLYPTYQLSTTDGLGAFTNMTNLGIKAAVGLSAYGQLSGQANYTSLGRSFAQTIQTVGVGVFISSVTHEPYFDLTYGDSAWYLTFNPYASALLNLGTFNASTYTAQSDFYPTVRSTGGVAIDSEVNWGKTDWDMWVAAISSAATRQMFVDDVWAYLGNGKNTQPFSDRYWVAGSDLGLAVFRARPTVGAHWAIWAIQKGANSG